jgi:predicted DCC family thiol-disulfide oxidoreductase YuxK
MKDRIIIFYDGDCGFCNRVVRFVLNHEKNESIYFSALQSEFAIRFLETHIGSENIDSNTLYLFNGKKILSKSTAALTLVSFLKWPWQFLNVFWILPKIFRDWCYTQIALRRHHIASKFCFLPTTRQQKRFLS